MVTTYFLAIENAPLLKQVFPTFTSYLAILSIIGIPLVIGIGFAHFKKIPAYKSEAEITVEANPYIYKLQPGKEKEVVFPTLLLITSFLKKISQDEKLTDNDLKKCEEIEKNIDKLLKGGYIGEAAQRHPFGLTNKKKSNSSN